MYVLAKSLPPVKFYVIMICHMYLHERGSLCFHMLPCVIWLRLQSCYLEFPRMHRFFFFPGVFMSYPSQKLMKYEATRFYCIWSVSFMVMVLWNALDLKHHHVHTWKQKKFWSYIMLFEVGKCTEILMLLLKLLISMN